MSNLVQASARKAGSALLFVMGVALILATVIGVVASVSLQNTQGVAAKNWQKQSSYAAYAGMQAALAQLQLNSAWNPGTFSGAMPGEPDLTYQVEVFNNINGTAGAFGPDNRTWVPAGEAYIYSLGRIRGREATTSAGYVALAGLQRPTFNHAIVGDSGVVTLNSSQVLVYDPNNLLSATQKTVAHVMSNVQGSAVGIVSTGSTIEGQLLSSPGVSPATAITVSGGRNAGIAQAQNSKVVTPLQWTPPAGFPVSTINRTVTTTPFNLQPGAYKDVTVKAGNTIVLAANTEYGFDNLILEAGAKIQLVGAPNQPVRLYLKHSMVCLNNNSVNWAGTLPRDPSNLQVYFTGPTAALQISGSNQISMVAAGKTLNATLSSSTVYGAVIADQASLNSSTLYFDSRLVGVPLQGKGGMSILNETALEPAEAILAFGQSSTSTTGLAAATSSASVSSAPAVVAPAASTAVAVALPAAPAFAGAPAPAAPGPAAPAAPATGPAPGAPAAPAPAPGPAAPSAPSVAVTAAPTAPAAVAPGPVMGVVGPSGTVISPAAPGAIGYVPASVPVGPATLVVGPACTICMAGYTTSLAPGTPGGSGAPASVLCPTCPPAPAAVPAPGL